MPAKKKTAPAKKNAAPASPAAPKKVAAKSDETKSGTKPVAKKVAAKKVAAKKVAAKKAPTPEEVKPEIPLYAPVGLDLAKLAARYADDKKATDIVILDVREISMVTDFYVLCSGNSLPQLRAIRKEVADMLWLNHDVRANRLDGQPESGWVVVDFFDVVVHIFQDEKRQTYALEDLWSDAPRIPYTPTTSSAAK
jgi:ribosome-associated protein